MLMRTRTAGILGASGYAGAELLRLLARHPGFQVAWASGEQAAGQAVAARYPTAALLALAPLVRAGVVEPDGIVVDAKSGLSGAGRSLADANLFAQANENVTPYGVGTHRHTPEIEQELGLAAGRPLTVTFTPHLVPATRGILATCYATLAGGADGGRLHDC